jgi:hypothetical protein
VVGEAVLIDADELIRQLARQRFGASSSTNPYGFPAVPKRGIAGMSWHYVPEAGAWKNAA